MRQARDDQLPLSLIRFELDHRRAAERAALTRALQDLHVKVANMLRGESRDCDIPGRLGEHGFALIMPGLTLGLGLAGRRRPGGSRSRNWSGAGCRLTASFGVAPWVLKDPPARRVLEDLRIRRRVARADGGDRVVHLGRRCRGCGPYPRSCPAQSSSMISSESSMTTGIEGTKSSCCRPWQAVAMMSCSDEETTISSGEGSGKPSVNAAPAAAGGD